MGLEPPLPSVAITVEVLIGFRKVKVTLTDEGDLATCNYDKLANAIRQGELAIATAFKDFLK